MTGSTDTRTLWSGCMGLALIGAILSGGCASGPDATVVPTPGDPSTVAAQVAGQPSNPIIRVANDASITLNGKRIRNADIVATLLKAGIPSDMELKLVSQPEAPFNTVVAVMRELREKGFSRVSLIVEKKTSDPAAPPAKQTEARKPEDK